MENEHAIHALTRKRAEIAGRIEHHRTELRQAAADLASVDRALQLFAPGIKPQEIRARRFRPDALPRGEVTRHVLDALRSAQAPMTAAQLAAVVLERRGLATALPRTREAVTRRTRAALCEMRKRGLAVSEYGADGLLAWRLK